MPRLTQSLPKYRKHRASGQALVTLGGRDFYLGPHGTQASRQEYDRLIAEWLANGRQRPADDATGLSVAELMVAYVRYAADYYRRDGVATGEYAAIKCALRYIEALYRNTSVESFGPLAVKAVRAKMTEAGLARSTVNQNIGRIVRMFVWGASEQLVSGEVANALKLVPGLRRGRTDAREGTPVLPVDDSVVEATLPFLPPIVADMVRLQRLTGMRPGEVCLARPCDVERSADVWVYRPSSHKTQHRGRERRIYIGQRGQEVLRPYPTRSHRARTAPLSTRHRSRHRS
ncbi:hypothetical protein Pla123a_41310 [Posidoniimonas polymericola]|uniref:Core-binding (CB) domain-containing protein n=1 Tax=Posidoniimonas polymericola TaxID=2528002 RepID=A0A5C5YBR1_9BACT|nr:site-specific integrase [Posidoniimonas polymericola]TWT72830.1 hypothetical protein Pla123a_41310 [Posidoniimonas polymericola]